MASTAAILDIYVRAQTSTASSRLMKVNKDLKVTEGQANRSAAAAGKLGKALKLVGIAAGAAAAYGLYKAVSAGATFEKQMDSLGSVSEASGKQMKRFEQQALKLGESTQYTANQVAEAQTELAKGGLAAAQILKGGVKAALNLAAAGQLELSEAAETTVNVMKLFGIEARDAGKIADALATAANRTTADVSDFAAAFKQGGSAVKAAGGDFNTAMTILEALAESGIKNSDAGTSMKTALIQLAAPTKKQAELAEALNLHFFDQNGNLKTAVGLSQEFTRVLKGKNGQERVAVAKTLAGTDGFRTLLALWAAGPEKLRKLEQANLKTGTAQEIARKKMDNLTGDTEQLTGALETQGIVLYQKLQPALRDTVQWMTKFVQSMGKFNIHELAAKLGIGDKELKQFGEAAHNAAEIFRKYVLPVIKTVIGILIKLLQDFALVVRGVVRIITGILTGDFGEAWRGVKDIFKGGIDGAIEIVRGITKPIRMIAAEFGRLVGNAFSKAWEGIESVFNSAKQAIIDVINSIIDVINVIPGIPDIGHVGGGPGNLGGENRKGPKGQHETHRARGGPINIGAPSGDTVPAMLERGEYVLNKKAVAAVGKARLDTLNFQHAPRYSVGSFIGEAADTVTGLPGKVANIANKGASYFIDKLPTPHIPEPFAGLGPYMIAQVSDYIKSGFDEKKFGKFTSKIGGIPNAGPLKAFNHTYPSHSLSETAGRARFSEALVARIARWAGLPGRTFAQIAHGESNFYPGIYGIDPGGTIGRGLWAITSGVGNDAMISKFGGPGAMFNPLINAEVAKQIYDGAGQTISPWYGTKYVTGHARGGPIGGTRKLWSGIGPTGLQSGIRNLAAYVMDQHPGLQVTSTTGGTHATNSLHYSGQAVDLAGSGMEAASKWIGASGLYRALAEGIHNPSLSVADGSFVPSSYWGPGTWADHMDHIHLGVTSPWSKAGFSGGAGGPSGPTEGQKKQAEGRARKKAVEAQLAKLRTGLKEAKTDPAKQSKLWQIVKLWGRSGIFDKDERAKVLEMVQTAASQTNVGASVKALQNLAAYAGEHGEITGKDPSNWHSLIDAMNKAQERGQDARKKVVERQRQRGHNKRIAAITSRASLPDVVENLEHLRAITDRAEEVTGQVVTLEPENVSDEYVGQERSGYEGVLGDLLQWRNATIMGRSKADLRILQFENQIRNIQALKGTRAFQKQKYKLHALREGIITTKALRDETLLGELEEIQGPFGPMELLTALPSVPVAGQFGGRIFDTQNTIRELGLKTGSVGGGEGDSARVALLEELLRQANQRNLIFERQSPLVSKYAGAFAAGGVIPTGRWGIAGEAGPEVVQGPARVFSNSESAGMAGPIKVEVRVLDGAVDTNKIQVIAEGAAVKVTKAQGRSARSRNPRAGIGV